VERSFTFCTLPATRRRFKATDARPTTDVRHPLHSQGTYSHASLDDGLYRGQMNGGRDACNLDPGGHAESPAVRVTSMLPTRHDLRWPKDKLASCGGSLRLDRGQA
jgi:hypothetical protein